jgi:hypothetical protein
MIGVTFLTREFEVTASECPACNFLMIKFFYEFEAFRAVTGSAVGRHRGSVGSVVTALAVGFFIRRRHIFKNLVDVAGETGHFAVSAGELEFSTLVVIELYPGKSCCDVTERTCFVDLSLVVWVAMAVGTFGGRNVFKFSGGVAAVTIENLVFSGERKFGLRMSFDGERRVEEMFLGRMTTFAALFCKLVAVRKTVTVGTFVEFAVGHFESALRRMTSRARRRLMKPRERISRLRMIKPSGDGVSLLLSSLFGGRSHGNWRAVWRYAGGNDVFPFPVNIVTIRTIVTERAFMGVFVAICAPGKT